jgi:hypothetical protein
MNTQAYLYKWTELSTGKWYVGSRTRKNCHPNDGYICSSKIVKPLVKANPNNWSRQVLCIGQPEDMRILEAKYLQVLDAASDTLSYNQQNQNGKFSQAGKSPWNKAVPMTEEQKEKIRQKRKLQICTDETRKKMSASGKGKPKSVEHNKKNSEANKGRIKSEETRLKLSIANKGKSPPNKGLPSPYKGVAQELAICPHCHKEGGKNSMKRWHFERCKFNRE